MNRREFLKGASLGIGVGALGAMGLYSYTPMRRAFLPKIERNMADFGVCKSVKVTNISETSWFDNGIFMQNVTGAGGLLVDQYTYNWAPFGNGKGIGKGTYDEGMAKIKPYLQKGQFTKPGPSPRKTPWTPTTRAASPASWKSKPWTAPRPSICSTAAGTTTGWRKASSAKA